MTKAELAQYEAQAQTVLVAQRDAFDDCGCSTGQYALDEFYFTREEGHCAGWAPQAVLALVAEVRRLQAEIVLRQREWENTVTNAERLGEEQERWRERVAALIAHYHLEPQLDGVAGFTD